MDDIDKQALETAAYDGNIEAIEDAVKNKKLLFEPKILRCIISIAIAEARFTIVNYLFKNGVSLNEPNESGVTPLAAAVWAADLAGVRYLVEKGVSASQLDNEGESLLFRSIDGEVEAAIYGMDSHDHNPPLANVEITELLIKSGADTNAKNKEGKTPLEFAINRHHKKAEHLLRKLDGNQ